ncbi:uncharacterized protein LOC112151745 isoform X2 [Oryzias melastigma]|uniref:uncharacterized protein LOC112151745 isoform X2 n=1 Tax=Oryzias melastigma TaxID=30732 RepID=UPI000CF8308B|nr:uncharacterized protein LOC112151745 isoform X2 [Oryzias melastigma]
MALSRVLNERTDCPYSKPPNLHISVLKMQEEQRVVDWFFTEISAKAATVKKNRVAVISDGHSLATITLFEEYKGAVKEGTSYIIVGYGLRGQSPPYLIKIDRQTKFFRGSDISISPGLINEAEKILNPPSKVVNLRESAEEKGLVTIQGTVVELLSLKKVQAGRNLVPLRNIGVQKFCHFTQDEFMISIWLWRELSVISLSIGDMITVSHLKVDSTMYRHQLKSTRYSKLEKTKTAQTPASPSSG